MTDLSDAFVGRTLEIEALGESLARARAGTGRVVLLIGEPGIGKTRLSDEFTRRARDAEAEVLAGRCYEGPGAPAFWPWTQVVRAYLQGRDAATLARELGAGAADVAAVVPEVHAQLPGLSAPVHVGQEQARFRFFEALTRALVTAAARRPLVVMLEDLHGADASSLMLLQFVAREIRTAPLMVVATLRETALAPLHPLAATLGELVREQVSVRLELHGLAVAEVAALMRHMAGSDPPADVVAAVHARTDGNPLYVTEIVRNQLARGGFATGGAGWTMPETVRNAIARHLGALSPDARATLTVGALFGREFRLDVVARAIGTPVATVLEHVDEATTARVVAAKPAEPGRYRFVHALFAETLGAALGEARRVALHRQAARALAADAQADALVPEIAHHWFAAGPGGDPARAVEGARRAAERALAMLAYEEAAEWYGRALEALGWQIDADRSGRAELLLGAGEARKRAGHAAAAKAAFEEAAALGRALDSAELLTRAALGHAPAVMYAEQAALDPAVVEALEEAIAAWQGRDSALHASALARLGVAHLFGDQPRRIACETEALAMARRLDDPEALRVVLAAWLSSNHPRHDVADRHAFATELARLAEEARDLEALAIARLRRVTYLVERGDVASADAELIAFARLADDLRMPVFQWYARVMHVMRQMLAGRFAEAEATIHEALAFGSATLPYAAPAYFASQVLVLDLLRGVGVEPVEGYRAVFQHHPDPAALSPLVWAYCEIGRFDEARQIFEQLAADDFAVLGKDVLPVLTSTLLAEGCAMLADEARAVHLYDRLRPYADLWVTWAEGACVGPVTHALGLLARTMGRFDDGARHFEAAIADTRRAGARPHLARALHEYAVLLQRRGEGDDAGLARTVLDESRALAAEMGMAGLAAKIAVLTPEREGAGKAATRAPGSAATVFRREGDYWVIAYAGTTLRLRDARGLGYLATLLYHPGREFHAAELVAGDGNGRQAAAMVVDPAAGVHVRRALDDGAGLSPDAQARAGYARRVREVAEELAEAERHHDLGHAERLRVEREMLQAELVGTMRGRRTGTHAERARLTVTKGIGSALTRIADAHPHLGAHLAATIRRGYFCVYVPDPRHTIDWER